jgi:hypothetical protein
MNASAMVLHAELLVDATNRRELRECLTLVPALKGREAVHRATGSLT